jgi:DNA helicase HerA-like ATPase
MTVSLIVNLWYVSDKPHLIKQVKCMEDPIKQRDVGSVVADDASPSFDVFRFKANANEYVYPGALVGTYIDADKFLLGRVSASIEINPHESAGRAKVREAMGIEPDYPTEELSTNIYRQYEADIIEEGVIFYKDNQRLLRITEPSDMAKAGAVVFTPSEFVVAQAMGFHRDPQKALCLGRTRITADDVFHSDKDGSNNVLLKPEIIQRHLFIGGTTGSGKSFAAGIILEEVSKFNIPIIILDSQNEYFGVAEGLGGKVLRPGIDYTVRLSSLTETEILELVPTLKGTLGHDLLAFTFLRLKREILQGYRNSFGLSDLIAEMEKDGPSLKLSENSLRIAIQRTQSTLERHKFLGEKTNWVELLKVFPAINIDCGDLDQSQLQLVVGATLRELQRLRLNQQLPPYVAVLDEAHLLVPEGEDSPCKQVIRENVRIGRHYGICMILITQSPVDIDKKTIRQCNTRFIFALEPDQLESIKGVKADATEDMLHRLPKMPRGTCILSGTYETIRHAIPIKIRSDRKTTHGGNPPNIFKEVAEWKNKK